MTLHIMGLTRAKKIFMTVSIGLVMLFGIGAGHSLFMQQFSSHNGMKMSHETPCQSVCSTATNQKPESPEVEKDEDDSNPIYSVLLDNRLVANYTYALGLAVLLWAFLRQRPPDIIIQYNKLRN